MTVPVRLVCWENPRYSSLLGAAQLRREEPVALISLAAL